MPLYYGKSKYGSDMKKFEGMYVSSCGSFWSSEPFTPEIEEQLRSIDKGVAIKPEPIFEPKAKERKPCERHEYTLRRNGKWHCRHCERGMKD